MQIYHSFLIVSINVLILNSVSICRNIKALIVFFYILQDEDDLICTSLLEQNLPPKAGGGIGPVWHVSAILVGKL